MTINAESVTLNDHDRLAIVGVVNFEHEGEAKSRWTTIGTAFKNKDGSFNLRFEYMRLNAMLHRAILRRYPMLSSGGVCGTCKACRTKMLEPQ